LLLILIGVLCSCKYYDKEYYERISGINFPSDCKHIDTFDNGEFLTISVFEVDSLELANFCKGNHLVPCSESLFLRLYGGAQLREPPPAKCYQGIYYVDGERGKNSWIYVADIKRNLLWARIEYPDWGGK